MDLARFVHVLGAVIWVGGMFFAYMALRPAAAVLLQPPERLKLWRESFRRFFFWVWISVGAILGSGIWMIMLLGGLSAVGHYVYLMVVTGVVMMGIFGHVYFAPYQRLVQAVERSDWSAAGAALGQIRKLVAVNLGLGIVTIAAGTAGRWLH